MEISLVNLSEVEEIEALCKRAFDQMDYSNVRGYTYDSAHIIYVITKGLGSWKHILTKCVINGKIVGFMAVEIADFSFHSINFKRANELVWHGDPALSPYRQLLVQKALAADMIQRTNQEGADLQMAIDPRYPILGEMLTQMGFSDSSVVFTRRAAL